MTGMSIILIMLCSVPGFKDSFEGDRVSGMNIGTLVALTPAQEHLGYSLGASGSWQKNVPF